MRVQKAFPTAAIALVAIAATSAEAQRFPALHALELRPGIYWPENAEAGFGVAGDVDLGWIRFTNLRAILGTHSFSADVDEQITGDNGGYSAFGGRAGLRLETFRIGTVRPHLTGALTATRVDADLEDPRSSELLDGFYVGLDLGVGGAMPLSRGERLSAVAEWRRTFSSNINRYALELGVRYRFGGA
jgi:hypothetical protein